VERLDDCAVRLARPEGTDAAALVAALLAHPGVLDVIVSELHVAVVHAPGRPPEGLEPLLGASAPASTAGVRHVVRVRYDGPDLAEAAQVLHLTPAQLVRRHATGAYRVQLVGFLPGFAYLGPLDDSLRLPRRATPRQRVPAGSVAIAGPYSGIYPSVSPGGWWLIGSAPGFQALGPLGPLLALGDQVVFEALP
jgi:KipI family sensor histidine kinase inhibitor